MMVSTCSAASCLAWGCMRGFTLLVQRASLQLGMALPDTVGSRDAREACFHYRPGAKGNLPGLPDVLPLKKKKSK